MQNPSGTNTRCCSMLISAPLDATELLVRCALLHSERRAALHVSGESRIAPEPVRALLSSQPDLPEPLRECIMQLQFFPATHRTIMSGRDKIRKETSAAKGPTKGPTRI
ncbi:uncharacterized protein TRIVIDRAFT_216000 [Trichoderma virens Gv29-8]|uniref:Uncharacterized protein n=1 Tax=Hypocrea virens (strain Gv29-8 / FGSC 10586) TaxID=413071 RepID=G9MTB6_HYPVG|nr:uncharacterized protein TRIVIDRAFT_216000 [Trichoderma virens Gv29-8]EHK22316.1 hypothetical protein TRIVIDRAFT_216000 [Trichoderma virens Gv29-8]